jgi:hypothetical protein
MGREQKTTPRNTHDTNNRYLRALATDIIVEAPSALRERIGRTIKQSLPERAGQRDR